VSIVELAVRREALTLTLSVAVLIHGWLSFQGLPRLGEPGASTRETLIVTPYPGASPEEVEREISERIERAVRELGRVQGVESYSSRGRSLVKVRVHDRHGKARLRQVRDALRHRIGDLQAELPPGAGPSLVDEDFGDIYGFYYALTGAGFTASELRQVARLLQRNLSTVDGIRTVALFGERNETIYVEISQDRIKAFGMDLSEVVAALPGKNLPADGGRVRAGPEHIGIHPDKIFRSEQDLGGLMFTGSRDRLVRLGDIAEIRRGYEDPPRRLLYLDGQPAVGIAIATSPGSDIIEVGRAVENRLGRLAAHIPLGMDLEAVSLQSETVAKAIDGLVRSLIQAAVMIFAALPVLMGLRAGLVVGLAALLPIAGTLVLMDYLSIPLDRVSLGALIVALGLLTGNLIRVVYAMKARMEGGGTGAEAAREVASGNALPLLGGTAVIALAFASIGGVENGAGGYARALYPVILIALAIGWVAAMTTAPVLACRLLDTAPEGSREAGPFGRGFQRRYAALLRFAVRRRRVVAGSLALLLALSLYGFEFVPRIHFPPVAAPSFLVEVYLREGTHIGEAERQMVQIQAFVRDHPGVTRVATSIGAGHPRSAPVYNVGLESGPHYGASLVFVDDRSRVDALRLQMQADLSERFPDAIVNVKTAARASVSAGGRVQLRISGPDPAVLRHLADRARSILVKDPDAKAVRDEWGPSVKVAKPVLAGELTRRLRIDRTRIADALRTNYSGTFAGFFGEDEGFTPIVVRAPREERERVEGMASIQVTSPLTGDRVGMRQLVNRLETLTEDARRSRRDHHPVIVVHADAGQDLPSELLGRVKPRIKKALGADLADDLGQDPAADSGIDNEPVPAAPRDGILLAGRPGYFIAWGGEAEEVAESQTGLAASIPVCTGLALLIAVALFNSLRQPLIVLLSLPLSLIGVAAGLLLTGQPFGFMSLPGLLGVSGILGWAAIQILSQIDRELRAGKARLTAIEHAISGLLRPLGLAAATAVLAVLPLLTDDLLASTAAAIVFGLAVAFPISLLVTPVLYAILYQVGNDETG
jgi:multidrug efflux pump subunit AcrB